MEPWDGVKEENLAGKQGLTQGTEERQAWPSQNKKLLCQSEG
jgi:hypothetical protein